MFRRLAAVAACTLALAGTSVAHADGATLKVEFRIAGVNAVECLSFGGLDIKHTLDSSGRPVGKPVVGPLTCLKRIDAASPRFAAAVATSEIVNGTIALKDTDGTTITFTNARIVSLKQSGAGTAAGQELVTFVFGTAKLFAGGSEASIAGPLATP